MKGCKRMSKYYPINEDLARRAKEMNSFYDYVPGSATAEYQRMVDEAAEIAYSKIGRASCRERV